MSFGNPELKTRPGDTVTCIVCSNPFVAKRHWEKCCSPECKRKNLRLLGVRNAKGKHRQRYAANQSRMLARQAVYRAVRAGTLVRPTQCSRCPAVGKMQGHHHKGYAAEFQLDVEWLCGRCHKIADNRVKKQRPKRVAEHAADVLRETGIASVEYGDTQLLEAIIERSGIKVPDSPSVKRQQRVLQRLEHSPLFVKGYAEANRSKRGHRGARIFTLRQEA